MVPFDSMPPRRLQRSLMRVVVRALRANVTAARRKESAAQRMIAQLRKFRLRAIMKARDAACDAHHPTWCAA